ncbi:ABC transporter substrate-binding protein [Pandoraea pnomenusa]|nr:ABC transporter substrate-binding protein [Pandoraea pnomenusa]
MAAALSGLVHADIKVGVILSTTGPAASLGTLEKSGVMLGPDTLGGQKVKYIYLDDASDPSLAVRSLHKLISEEHVDVVIGPTTTPSAVAVIPLLAESGTPGITQGPTNSLVQPVDAQRRWNFKTTTNDEHEGTPLFDHMKAKQTKTLAFIGFTDSYGDQWLKLTERFAKDRGIQVVSQERYARTDSTVTSQVVKMLSKQPDAVLIAGSGGAAATPLLELRTRGYKGDIYVTLGATFGDFLRLSGAAADGIFAPYAAVMGVDQVPDTYAAKKSAAEFVRAYDAKYGGNTSNIFSAGAWDANKLIANAVPEALKKASPGTPQFRAALRDAIEATKDLAGARGVYNMSATDHTGLDISSLMLGQRQKGRWVLAK